jgi:hypothetical protein
MSLDAAALAEAPVRVAKQPAPLALRLAFSFPVALSVLLIVLMVLTVRHRFNDPDMWWHLKTGEIIWNTHHIPTVDTFSYTTHNHSYVPHEWLAQLSIYGAWRFGGYTGMMLWLCLFGSLLLITGYILCSVYSGNAKVAFLGAMAIWLLSTVGLSIRPQMIGYLFLICELLILHWGKTRSSRWFLALPPLFVVWVNCHGSFFLGLVVAGIVLACSFLEFRMGLLMSEKWESPRRMMLAGALALSAAALFINPIGWQQVTYPLDTMFHQSLQKQIVSEWQALNMGSPRGAALLVIAALVLMLPMLRGVRLRVDELLILGFVSLLAIHHSRMVFVFGFIAAPILCRLLGGEWENYELKRDRILPNLVVISISLLVLLLSFPSSSELAREVKEANPVSAIKFMRQAGLNGNMLNDYTFGGYLIWSAPERKVFLDGRGDVFEWTGVLAEYNDFFTLAADPEVLLHKYGITTCLLARHAPISRVLTQWLGWKVAYSDDLAEVLVRTTPSKPIL